MSESIEIIMQPFVTQQQMDSAETLSCPVPAEDIGEEITPVPTESVCETSQAIVEYEDLMYLPATKAFYLLTAEAIERIKHAESQLESLFFTVADEQKYQGLAKAGLIDSFISADLASFLEGKEKQDFIQARDYVQNPEKLASEFRQRVLNAKPGSVSAYEADASKKDYQNKYHNLKRKALSKAKSLKYKYQNGALYSEREVKIQAQIKRYNKAKSEFLGKKELPPQEQVEQMKQQLEDLQAFSSKACYHVGDAARYSRNHDLTLLAKQEKALPELMGAIESLANYSIATPEFALSAESHDGHASLARYYALYKDIEDIRASINNKMKATDEAGNKWASMLPKSVFQDEIKQIKKLQKQAFEIKLTAQNNAMNFDNPMYLLWEPEQYKPKPLSRLAKGTFPLREYVTLEKKPENALGKGYSQLRYLTLTQLPQNKQKALSNEGSFKPSSTDVAMPFYVETSPDEDLLALLGPHIKKLSTQKDWFNDDGVFIPEQLLDYLQVNLIKVTKLEGDITEWKRAMVELLYSKELQKRLDPFDASPQAQMFRMVKSAKTSSSAAQLLNLTIKDFDKISVAKFEASAEFSAARGEINLFKTLTGKDALRYPEEVNKEPIELSYEDREGNTQTISFDNGGLQLRLYCKAYGFVGACIEFAPEVALTRSADESTGSHLAVTGYKVMQETGTIELNSIKAFISAEAGIELGAAIDWHLPASIPAFALDGGVSDKNTVLPLIKAAVKLEVSAGINLPIRFRMKSGKPCVKIQIGPPGAKIAFEGEMDPSAIGIWVTQFQRLLRQCKYRKLTVKKGEEGLADQESFDFMASISKVMLVTQLNVGVFFAQGKDRFDSILSFLGRSERAGMLGYILSNAEDETSLSEWMILQPPEAIGPMLRTLIADPEEGVIQAAENNSIRYTVIQAHVWQQTAIANIVRWLFEAEDSLVCYAENQIKKVNASQRQMEESLIRMNSSSSASDRHTLKVEALFAHREELEGFMSTRPIFTESTRGLERSYLRTMNKFENQLDKLLMHTENWMTEDMKKQIEIAKAEEALRYVNF